MTRLAIVVEGQTEEEFVKQIIAPELASSNTVVEAININGDVRTSTLAKEMGILYETNDHVTSLVDLYEYTNRNKRSKLELENAITERMKQKIGNGFDPEKVTAYIQQYEFESLLFSDPQSFKKAIPGVTHQICNDISRIRNCFNTPEDINDTQETAPSNRLKRLIQNYHKVSHGIGVAKHTGLNKIRQECPGFNKWLCKLESL